MKTIELNDGHGSYVCSYGHTHDYSKFDFDEVEQEIAAPSTKKYGSLKEMWNDIYLEETDLLCLK
ncbi:MAG: hypothetical protein FWG90_06390 [Oscillospiraceae bacterium]|nr:hypothetical protein [Oscillospiraceae bacterium]